MNIEKTFELLSEFSSELKLKRSIEKIEIKLKQIRAEELKCLNGEDLEFSSMNNSFDDTSENLFNEKVEVLEKSFNILDFKRKVGFVNVFPIVCANIFEHNGLFKNIYKGTFVKFINEMNSAYVNKNSYHNVLV